MKKLVFIRHAHRDTSDRGADNGISEKGHHQVQDLLKLYKKEKLPFGSFFYSSPKQRCVETLEPLANEADLVLKIEKLLDEQQSSEDTRAFHSRIHKIIELIEAHDKTIYLCSHGDVLPLITEELIGYPLDFKKGEALVFHKEDGKWQVE